MKDIIESGIWAKLSPAARALYPVLCSFTNENFKPAWPGTEKLLQQTGFKTKKSLQQAKKDLIAAGLIDVIPGTGRTPSRYYFRFEYQGCSIDIPQRDTEIPPRMVGQNTPEGYQPHQRGDTQIPPNHIHININNQSDKQTTLLSEMRDLLEDFVRDRKNSGNLKEQIVDDLIQRHGQLETGEAMRIAIKRGRSGDIKYLEGILRNRREEKNRRSRGQNSEIETKLDKLRSHKQIGQYIDKINLQYEYNNKYFFITEQDLPVALIKQVLAENGIPSKIYVKSKVRPISLSG